MALLQVRDFPSDLYEELGRRAKDERRSLAQQTVVIMRDALQKPESDKERRQRVMAEAREFAKTLPQDLPDPVALIREDRDR